MKILRAVVDTGSFTSAAKALGMHLASVSRKIGELENHLGTRLLARSTRRIGLTDAGVAYLEASRRILDEVEEAERAAAGEYLTPRGELVVTAPILFGRLHVLPIVTDFLVAHREIDVRLLLSDRNLHLIEDHVDLGVRIGSLPNSDLISTRVGQMRTVLCAAPTLIAKQGEPTQPSDLTPLPCVSFDIHGPTTHWSFRDPQSQTAIDVPIRPRLSTTTAEAAVEAAVRGVGITRVYHYQAQAALDAGSLQILLKGFEPSSVAIQLIHAGRDRLPLKTRVFLDFAARILREVLSHPA